ncbi:MAG: hypothetical protein G01um101438_642 [Parcubacteria group bacterium Gr01-1014_38]|nr:MAG: hypothetical protein G01um101438_642 [Parcubacteria group bacterium Gr01-1014_38]
MNRSVAVILSISTGISVALFPLRVSADIWNPFDGVPERLGLFTEVRNLLRGFVEHIEEIAGRPVSRFKIPDRLNIGFRPRGFYRPPGSSPGVPYPPPGFRTRGTPPSPIPGELPINRLHDGFQPDTLEQQDFGHTHTPTP